MILALVFYLLPVAFSAVLKSKPQKNINPFNLCHDPGFVQEYILDYFPLHNQMNFMLTCRDFFILFHDDYDEILAEITNSEMRYIDADKELQFDIRKLWMLFKIEMQYRNSNECFTLGHFYQILSGSFFTNPSRDFRKYIYKQNYFKYKSLYGDINDEDSTRAVNLRFDCPLFPQISLILLKAVPSQSELKLLVRNACRFPHIFDSFFKYLARNVYNVPRDLLHERIEEELDIIKNEKYALKYYHNHSIEALFLSGIEISTSISLALLLGYYKLHSKGYSSYPLKFGVMFTICGLLNATYYIALRKFYNFYPVYLGVMVKYYPSKGFIVS